jgi:hypothetical protein
MRFVFTSDGSVVQEGIGIDSIVIGNTPTNVPDIGVVQLLTPTAPVLNQDHNVKIVIRNFSANAINSYLVSYTVNGVLVDANTLSRSIQPNDTIHHIFTGRWRPTVGGTHRLCAYTSPVPGQTNNANDTACRVFTSVGLNDALSTGLTLYPNPAQAEALLQWGENMEAQRLEWRDAGGRMIYANDFTNPSGMESGQERQARVIVAQWSPGLYFGTLTLRDGRCLRLKLMVQP